MPRALITGTSSGIGHATARRLLSRGREVVGLARRERVDLPAGYRHVAGDIRDPEAREAAVRAAEAIDLLVLNAGVCAPNPLADSDAEAVWHDVLDTNLHAPFALLHRAAPTLQAGGSVVCIASTLGLRGRAGYAAYCASKHGLLGMVRATALELAPKQIRVNAICPGWTETPMAEADLERVHGDGREGRGVAEGELPLGRFAKPGEIAELVAFLASDAARSITGQAYEVSGGEGI